MGHAPPRVPNGKTHREHLRDLYAEDRIDIPELEARTESLLADGRLDKVRYAPPGRPLDSATSARPLFARPEMEAVRH